MFFCKLWFLLLRSGENIEMFVFEKLNFDIFVVFFYFNCIKQILKKSLFIGILIKYLSMLSNQIKNFQKFMSIHQLVHSVVDDENF